MPPPITRPTWFWSLAALACVAASARAGEPVPLWPGVAPGAPLPAENLETHRDGGVFHVYQPNYQHFPPAAGSPERRAAVVVLPGGGYGMLATGWEGEPVARWFSDRGFNAILLHYRVSSDPADGYQHPVPLLDAQRAVRTVRAQAGRWGVDPDKVGVIGFSAGGHLAATLSNLHAEALHTPADETDTLSARPDFTVLVYPVVSLQDQHGHPGSRRNLVGENPDPATVQALSIETRVTGDTPPAFLVHGADDTVVPASNSVAYYQACTRHGVPAELHIFRRGAHGFAMRAPAGDPVAAWPDLLAGWLDSLGGDGSGGKEN